MFWVIFWFLVYGGAVYVIISGSYRFIKTAIKIWKEPKPTKKQTTSKEKHIWFFCSTIVSILLSVSLISDTGIDYSTTVGFLRCLFFIILPLFASVNMLGIAIFSIKEQKKNQRIKQEFLPTEIKRKDKNL